MTHPSLNPRFACEEGALEALLTNLQAQQLLTIVNHETGADREQWMIRYHHELFVIFVECLSESAWLEPVQGQGKIHLTALQAILR